MLRVDVQRFFPSIDHAILRRLLDRVTPPALRWLRDVFLDAPLPDDAVEPVAFHLPGDDLFTPFARPHGLPIGSLTSQIWANLHLAPLDHLLAAHLGLGEFVRYCDDVLVFADDPGRLRDALARLRSRAAELRLRLHPDKTRLSPRSPSTSGPGSPTPPTATPAPSSSASTRRGCSGGTTPWPWTSSELHRADA